jgi:ureidoglycolate lyase
MSPETRVLRVRPVDREAFAPYGQLLESPGETWRLDFAARLDNARPSARPNLALVRVEPSPLPLRLDRLERHPHSSQAFFPLDLDAYLVVVCRSYAEGRPDPSTLAAFSVRRAQAINYAAGTWHHGMATLGGHGGTFAMLIFEDGSPEDCHFSPVEPFLVEA